MKKEKVYATEVDRLCAGIQRRMVSRRIYLNQMEVQYGVARQEAKPKFKGDIGNREAGKLGRRIRNEIRDIANDQKLDRDTMKALRRCQNVAREQVKQLNVIALAGQKVIIAANEAFNKIAA